MPRSPSFPISRRRSGKSVFWAIYLPPSVNPTGRKGFAYYHTKAEAESARARFLQSMREMGGRRELSPAAQLDAVRALERLNALGFRDVSLLQAVEAAAPLLSERAASCSLADCVSRFAEVKSEGWSVLSRRNFAAYSRRLLAGFAGARLSDVSPELLESWLAEEFAGAGARAAARRTLNPMFSWAVRRRLLQDNPFSRLERVRAVRHADGIDVFSPHEVRALLGAAPDDCKVPFALLLFAGIRPAELRRLRWGDLRLDEGFVFLAPGITKTRQVRMVPIEPVLAAWLRAFSPDSPPGDGLVCPPNWHRKDVEARRLCGLMGRADAARHSYASYWLAMFHDAERLRGFLGHSRGSDTLFVHYRAAASPEAAREFWGIFPPGHGKM